MASDELHSNAPTGLNGFVVSDLHLFARRSEGVSRMESAAPALDQADVLVLNGDIFDFRWSALGSHEATLKAALTWLEEQLIKRPGQELHFVLGNHDCLDPFAEELELLATRHARFHWHPVLVQLGDALFIHGDCANGNMNENRFNAYRARWRKDRIRGSIGAEAYVWADRVGFTWLTHELYYPRAKTVRRLAYYLDQTRTGWRDSVRHCYFGHTHMPFQDFELDGVQFHNTGSAIKGMAFNPLTF